jgi:hypothetical protein
MGHFARRAIVTDGLVHLHDVANKLSYDRVGTLFKNMARLGDASFQNGAELGYSFNTVTLDGVDDFISLGTTNGTALNASVYAPIPTFTMEIWYKKVDWLPHTFDWLYRHSRIGGQANGFAFGLSDASGQSKISFQKYHNNLGGNELFISPEIVGHDFAAQMNQIVVTLNGLTLEFHLNGEFVSQHTFINQGIYDGNGYSNFGGGSSYLNRVSPIYKANEVGAFLFYNKPNTTAEIKKNYEAQKSRYTQ